MAIKKTFINKKNVNILDTLYLLISNFDRLQIPKYRFHDICSFHALVREISFNALMLLIREIVF